MRDEMVTVRKDFIMALAEAIYVRYEILTHLANKGKPMVNYPPKDSDLPFTPYDATVREDDGTFRIVGYDHNCAYGRLLVDGQIVPQSLLRAIPLDRIVPTTRAPKKEAKPEESNGEKPEEKKEEKPECSCAACRFRRMLEKKPPADLAAEMDKILVELMSKKPAPEPDSGDTIMSHEGKKYLRMIYHPPGRILHSVRSDGDQEVRGFEVDVYCVLEAFDVTCPATSHAVKKLLTAGQRGKGSRLADLLGAKAALLRAIELEEQREELAMNPVPSI